MAIVIRKAVEEDAATLAALNTDVQAIHAAALPWLFKPSAPDAFAPARVSDVLAQPELQSAGATVDDWTRHVRVAALIDAHRCPRRKAEDLGHLARVDELVRVHLAGHHRCDGLTEC